MPLNGDPKLSFRGQWPGRGGAKASANKETLEKLIAMDYKLPALILEHRRLSFAITPLCVISGRKTNFEVSPPVSAQDVSQDLVWPDREPFLVKKAIHGRENTQERKPQRLVMIPDILCCPMPEYPLLRNR